MVLVKFKKKLEEAFQKEDYILLTLLIVFFLVVVISVVVLVIEITAYVKPEWWQNLVLLRHPSYLIYKYLTNLLSILAIFFAVLLGYYIYTRK